MQSVRYRFGLNRNRTEPIGALVNRMLNRIARKQARIGVLVQEKFALQLLYQRNAHHLQRSRGDIGLLEFNRDRLYERYEKWKNKTQAAVLVWDNVQGKFQCPGHVPSKYPIQI